MHPAAHHVALRARKRRAPLEIDAQLKPPLIGIEDGIHDTPRLRQPKRLLKEIDITHHPHAADSAKRANRQLPTRFSEEPSNGDATFDPGEDRDGDGRLDVEEDVNGNGRPDPGEDVDGDMRLDNAEDRNGDGVLQLGSDREVGRSSLAPAFKTEMVVQGRGCMSASVVTPYVMVSIRNAQHDPLTHRLGGVRGFIADSALPSGLARGSTYRQGRRVRLTGMSNKDAFDLFDAKCSSAGLFPGVTGSAPADSEVDTLGGLNQAYRPDARYQGDSIPPITVGNYMANYNGFPSPIGAVSNPFISQTYSIVFPGEFNPAVVQQIPVMANTTGVGGGGIVRAILPVTSAYQQFDHFDYRDPNEYCANRTNNRLDRAAVAHTAWTYVKVAGTPVQGWIPRNLIKDATLATAQRCASLAGP